MWYEVIGYAASFLIALSLMMNSIVKLRTFGLAGSFLFSVYGFAIGAYPVGILNLLNLIIHSYYLLKARYRKDYFRILEVKPDNKYLDYFLSYNKSKIDTFFPEFEYHPKVESYLTFFVLRNLNVAGVFIGKYELDGSISICIDYVIPEYRDFKIGDYVYHKSSSFFTERNIHSIKCMSNNKKHLKYMHRMGFIVQEAQDQMSCLLKNI